MSLEILFKTDSLNSRLIKKYSILEWFPIIGLTVQPGSWKSILKQLNSKNQILPLSIIAKAETFHFIYAKV